MQPGKDNDIPSIEAGILSGDINSEVSNLMRLGEYLNNLKIVETNEEIVSDGVLDKLLTFLERNDHPDLVIESSAILVKLSSFSNLAMRIVERNGIKIFEKLINHSHKDIVQNAMLVLGNLFSLPTTQIHKIQDYGILGNVLEMLRLVPEERIQKAGIYLLSRVCQHQSSLNSNLVKDITTLMTSLIDFEKDPDILRSCLYGLKELTERMSKDSPNMLFDPNLHMVLIKLLHHKDPGIVSLTIRILGNLVSIGYFEDLSSLLAAEGFISRVLELANSPDKSVKRDALWLISNVVVEAENGIDAITSSDKTVKLIVSDSENPDPEIRKAAFLALIGTTSQANTFQMEKLVEAGFFRSIMSTLERGEFLPDALEGIKNVLYAGQMKGPNNTNAFLNYVKEANLEKRIKDLIKHPDQNISELAAEIDHSYFKV